MHVFTIYFPLSRDANPRIFQSAEMTDLIQNYTDHMDVLNLSEYEVNYVLPFSNHDNGRLMAIAGIYAMLFMLGTCGNTAILAVVHHVRSTDSRARSNTTLTYICILSIVDFVSMLPLPMTIIDQVLGFWMFGTFACKLFRLFEHIGKIFSTFILVCFSFDRYCAVCHPLRGRLRTANTAHLMLGAMFGITCVMLCPILIFAQSKEIVVHEKINTMTKEVTRLHLYKCVDDLGNELFILFTLTCFLFAYLVPLLLMIYFYYGMLMRLYKRSRAMRQNQVGARRNKGVDEKIPIAHIAAYTLAICLFHFVCWTPYWVSVLYSLYLEVFFPPDLQMPSSTFIYFMYGVHALPYINSASNFILYGLLNRQLHQSNSERRSRGSTGGGRSTAILQHTLHLTDCDGYNGVEYHKKRSPYDSPPRLTNGSIGRKDSALSTLMVGGMQTPTNNGNYEQKVPLVESDYTSSIRVSNLAVEGSHNDPTQQMLIDLDLSEIKL